MKLSRQFKRRVHMYIKESLDSGYSFNSINKSFILNGYSSELAEQLIQNYRARDLTIKSVPLILVFLLIMPLVLFHKSGITTLAFIKKEYNYTDKIRMNFNESSVYAWNLENKGTLKSIKLNGEVKLSGSVKVYLKHENITYLIFDNKKLEKKALPEITGYAVKADEIKAETKENLTAEEQIILNSLIVDINETRNSIEIEIETQKDNLSKEIKGNITQAQELLISALTDLLKGRDEKVKIRITSEFQEIEVPEVIENEAEATVNETFVNETPSINETLINLTLPINETNITNETAQNASMNKINLILKYNDGSYYDEDNNGIEKINGIIDFSVDGTEFNWDANKENVCTRWNTYSIDNEESTSVCYGNDKCCNFIELAAKRPSWNETFYIAYGKDSATFKNIISAQVLYVDYNLSLEKPYAEIYYSNWGNLTAEFYEEYTRFENICIETCVLPNINETDYELILEIENSSLILDSIIYEIEKEEIFNNRPILLKNLTDISVEEGQNYAINLSEYFYDEDNDTLAFSYYSETELDVSIINSTAVLAEDNFSGTAFMYFTANDSIDAVLSNIFKVEAKEIEKRPKILKSLRQLIGI